MNTIERVAQQYGWVDDVGSMTAVVFLTLKHHELKECLHNDDPFHIISSHLNVTAEALSRYWMNQTV